MESLHLILQNFWSRFEGKNPSSPTTTVLVIFWASAKSWWGAHLAFGQLDYLGLDLLAVASLGSSFILICTPFCSEINKKRVLVHFLVL